MDLNFENTLNEFYKLKSAYETINSKNRKIIINNTSLSKKEKQREFQRLKPKCINCKRPGGTLFTNTIPEKSVSTRRLSAVCGVHENPCNLKIILDISPYYLLNAILIEQEQDIKRHKNEIISLKNSILFGYATLEQVMPTFESYKQLISESMELYSSYLEEYYSVIDNKETNEEIIRHKINIERFVTNIKDSVNEFNKTSNEQFIIDAANIYIDKLAPLTTNLMKLQYKELLVRYDADDNVYNLIQHRYGLTDIEINSDKDIVVANDTGVKITKKSKT